MTAAIPQCRMSFEAIGTHWQIDIYDQVSPKQHATLETKIRGRIDLFDKTYSRFRKDSVLSQLAAAPGRVKLSDDAKDLFAFYNHLYVATNGKITPLIGNVMEDAGYDAEYSLRPKNKLSAAPKWEEVLHYDYPYLTVKQPAVIDVGAAGKGYLVDIIGELLDSAGVHNYLVDAGGDMLHHREHGKLARIGLEHPEDPSLVVGVVQLGNESICGSAGNRRKWADMHHIIDATTAKPAQGIVSVWVVARTAMLADGLATALFFTPAAELAADFTFEYFLIRSDMSVEHSRGLHAEIFGGNA